MKYLISETTKEERLKLVYKALGKFCNHEKWLWLLEKNKTITSNPNISLAISTNFFPLKSNPILDIKIILLYFFLLMISNAFSVLLSK